MGVGFGNFDESHNPKLRSLETTPHEMIFSNPSHEMNFSKLISTTRGRVLVFPNLTFYSFYAIIFT
jgi:hypothetical protein